MQQSTPLTIVVCAFVLDQRELTLYSPTGESVVIKQGDPRVAPILEKIQPFMAAQQTVEVNLGEHHTPTPTPVISEEENGNYFGEAEKKSGGVVRFFRVARSAVRKFFGAKDTPTTPVQDEQPKVEILAPCQGGVIPSKEQAAIEEVMANAIPSSSPDFKVPAGAEADDTTGDTVVAVVGDTLIPNVEALAPQIKHAVKSNSTIGVQRLMERIAAVAKKRHHSVEDLMKFMRLGDLPVNDNGDIVAFKALKNRSFGQRYDERFKWADIHSGNVPQRLGSLVYMDESLVDPDRRNDCSNGLHIASRSYLSGFRGDVCVVVLIRPEDVIAVPEYSHNKMRVCAYHIVAELSKDQYQKLLADKSFTDDKEGQLLLGRIMEGRHIPVTNKVRITAERGGGIIIEDVDKTASVPDIQPENAPVPEKPSKAPKRLATSLDNPNVKKTAQRPATQAAAAPVAVKDVLKKADTLKKGGQVAQAAELFKAFTDAKTKQAEKDAAQALLDFKKKAKKGWAVLGLPEDTGTELTKVVSPMLP
ncbi:RIIB lysis inhibitor [Achromobacter phage vB_AxyP_19-32_Axy24]|uniref:Putative rIIB lysis inhibitor n=1 Tax=Achromobacter phage vB_AxyP_19-32_Axy24 TaxID=2591048 RepID=A0A514CW75_9CAUD|nr:RIIB lysis inhibitor [Achromobacter phage vB_AxyP_19-32_Axy24]QDH84730.1 putative rIIB lysis inhibitor [Achromobacter phage vB_AxyP_19-32_Axy24]